MDWIDTEHKARKPHRCSLCGGTIDVGTKYIRQFHPQYKYASTMHKECQELSDMRVSMTIIMKEQMRATLKTVLVTMYDNTTSMMMTHLMMVGMYLYVNK